MVWPISSARSSTDRSPCASTSTISARRPLASARATSAKASNNASFATRSPTVCLHPRGRNTALEVNISENHRHPLVKYSFEYLNTGVLEPWRPALGLEIVAVTDEGLGHSAHLIAVDGEVLVIDPLRVVGDYVDTIEQNGWHLRWTADTHLHADYVSGGPVLSTRGAEFFAPRAAALEIPHRPLDGGDEVDVSGLTLRAVPTPGHTPDHLSYLLLDADRPLALFSGGSLMVGTVGRPDLFGPDQSDVLARAMFRSLH